MSAEPPAIPSPVEPLVISGAVTDAYDNRSIATVNDHEIRLSVMTSGFPWHRHPDSDETFAVLEGELVIEFEAGEVILKPGQMLTVRSEERRVGKECVRTCRSRGSPHH